ncbi:sugar kinase [Virgibacillus halodenitrificans]|uniref:sugar kinase n=1 Tax=Virgibacillus halodenitrificans TaxID=1482 RepID=UPI0002E17A34|nr:sugar kinase [Virgibacillus halodenitrificans]
MMGVENSIKAFGEVMMRLEAPDYLKLEQTRELKVLYSGTGVNILSALSRFGHATSLITKLPNNSIGDGATAYIRSLGISTSDILRGGDYIGMYFLERGFHVRSSKVTYSNRKESSFCTSNIAEYDLEKSLKQTSMIHFCGIILSISEQMRYNALYMAKKAKQLGIKVVFDFNYRPKLWKENKAQAKDCYESMLEYVDICFMTEKDARYILQMGVTEVADRNQQIENVIPSVSDRYQIPVIAGTIRENEKDGRNRIRGFLYHHGSLNYSQTYEYQTLERVGAGDAFSSGIMHGLSKNLSTEEMLEFATAACVLAHTTYGDSPVCSEAEIWAVVHNKEVEMER